MQPLTAGLIGLVVGGVVGLGVGFFAGMALGEFELFDLVELVG